MTTIINGSSPSVTFSDGTTQTTAPVNTNANVNSATAVAGTGISVTAITTTGAATHTITNTGVTSVNGQTGAVTVSSSSGTVTSVATGNGLTGGTITSTGTLSITAPTYQSVGSYMALYAGGAGTLTPNANYSGNQCAIGARAACFSYYNTGNAPGTWRALGFLENTNNWLGVRIS